LVIRGEVFINDDTFPPWFSPGQSLNAYRNASDRFLPNDREYPAMFSSGYAIIGLILKSLLRAHKL